MKQPELKMNFDLKTTNGLNTESGSPVWQEGVILRKVSRFVTGTSEDGVIPVPVFYDVKTGNVLVELLPKELRAEFEEESNDNI